MKIIILSLILLLIPISQIHADKAKECYSETMKGIIISSIFSNKDIDITDPEVRPFVHDWCRFIIVNQSDAFLANHTIPEALQSLK